MPNTSTAGRSWKGNPPPSNLLCLLTHTHKHTHTCTHSHTHSKKESIVFQTFRFHLEKSLRLKIWFSDFLPLSFFWFNGSLPLELHKKDKQIREREDFTLFLCRPPKSVKLWTGLSHCVSKRAPKSPLLSFSIIIIFNGFQLNSFQKPFQNHI